MAAMYILYRNIPHDDAGSVRSPLMLYRLPLVGKHRTYSFAIPTSSFRSPRLPITRPEVLLLHKAIYQPRPKDDRDFHRMLSYLNLDKRLWLRDAILSMHSDHPWITHLTESANGGIICDCGNRAAEHGVPADGCARDRSLRCDIVQDDILVYNGAAQIDTRHKRH